MNNRAQVLVIFVILLPLLILFSGYVVDTTIINYNKNKLDNISLMTVNYIKENLDIKQEEIEKLILKNDKNIVIKNIKITELVEIDIEKEIPSIFGRFIGKDKYTIKSNIKKSING